MTRDNKTFGEGDPNWANACVGDNRLPGYWDYATGFSRAANLLIDTVLQDRSTIYSVDVETIQRCFSQNSGKFCTLINI